MPHIAILSSSIRTGRASHRVALYFQHYLQEHQISSTEIIDLNAYQFPVFEERLKFQPSPSAQALDFAAKIKAADGIILVTPEYNGGYPASIKNAIDLLYDEWHRKPVAITTVSNGDFGGAQVITSLQFTLWKMKAWTVPAMFPVPNIDKRFNEQGIPTDKETTDKRAAVFINELIWCIEAKMSMEEK